MAQFARPDSDITVGSWIPYPSTPTTLFDKIDEVTPNDDTDYIYVTGTLSMCEVGLSDVTDPTSSIGHTMRIRLKDVGGGGAPERIHFRLYQGSTLIATGLNNFATPATYTTYEHTLTTAEADSITDYTDLRFQIESAALAAGETIRVTWAEFEVPDAGGVTKLLAGVIAGLSSTPSADVKLLMEFLATSAGQSAVLTAPLKPTRKIIGTSAGQSNVPSALVKIVRKLIATSDGQSALTAALTVIGVKIWNASGDSNWNADANWLPVGIPNDGDSVIANATSTYNCNIDGNTANLKGFTLDTGFTGTFSLNGNTLQVEYVADDSDFIGTQGTFNGGTGLIKVSGDWDTSSGTFTFTKVTCITQFSGDGNVTTGNNVVLGFYDVLVDIGTTRTASSQVWVSNLLTVNGNIAGLYWRLMGNPPIAFGGSGSASTARIEFGTQGNFNIPAGDYFGFSIHMGNGYKATLTGAVTSNYLSVYRSGYYSVSGSTELDLAGYSFTLAGTLVASAIGYSGGSRPGILTCGASTVDINGLGLNVFVDSYINYGTSVWTFEGNLIVTSTDAGWDEGTSIIEFDDDSAQEIDMNGQDLYDIEVSGTGQKNLTGSFKCRHFTAKNNVTVKITDTGVTWSTFADANITADATYLLTLRSSIDDNQWDMIAGTGNTALRVDVQDSNNTGTNVDATDASNVDSGNNDGWTFVGIILLEGSLAGLSNLPNAELKLLMEVIGSLAGQSNTPALELKRAFNILGSLAAQSGADGALGLFKLLVGSLAGESTVDGDIVLTMKMVGDVDALGNIPALGIKLSRKLGGLSEAQSAISPIELKASIKIAGEIDALTTLIGDLSVEAVILLEGSTAGVSSVLATPLEVLMRITGTVDAQSGMDGGIKLTIELIGDTGGLSSTDAILKAIRGLEGDVDALSSLSGTLQSIAYLLGTVAGTSGADGGLKITLQLVGTIDGQTVVLGDLTQITPYAIDITRIYSMMSNLLTKIYIVVDDLETKIRTER